MPVLLKNTKRTRQPFIVSLSHKHVCKAACMCIPVTMKQLEQGSDGVVGIRVLNKLLASSISIAYGEMAQLPDGVANIPEVKRALARGDLRMVRLPKQDPKPADAPKLKNARASAPSAKTRTRKK
jgi:hypothetical protein